MLKLDIFQWGLPNWKKKNIAFNSFFLCLWMLAYWFTFVKDLTGFTQIFIAALLDLLISNQTESRFRIRQVEQRKLFI